MILIQKDLGNQYLHYSHFSRQSYKWPEVVIIHKGSQMDPLHGWTNWICRKQLSNRSWYSKQPRELISMWSFFKKKKKSDEITLGKKTKGKCAEIWPLYEIIYRTELIYYVFLSSRILRNLFFSPPIRNNPIEHALNSGLCSLL